MALLMPFLIPLLLASVHLVGYGWQLPDGEWKGRVRSLAAGVSVVYVFLVLLPEITHADSALPEIDLMMILVAGFGIFHLVLKYLYQHLRDKNLHDTIDEIHVVAGAIFSFLITYTVTQLAVVALEDAVLLVVFVALHSLLEDFAAQEGESLDELQHRHRPVLFLATLAGGALAAFSIPEALRLSLFAATAGIAVYITLREEIPNGKDGHPSWFVGGLLSLALLEWVLRG